MKFKNVILFLPVLACVIFFSFTPAKAQFNNEFKTEYNEFLEKAGKTGTYDPDIQGEAGFINQRIGFIIALAISFIALFFLIIVIYSGFQWMTSSGNEEKVEQAKKRVINGTIGVILTLAAFTITNFVYNYFDAKFLQTPKKIETN